MNQFNKILIIVASKCHKNILMETIPNCDIVTYDEEFKLNYNHYINIGSCGAIQPYLTTGDIILVDKVKYKNESFDVNSLIAKDKHFIGGVITVDTFAPPEIKQDFGKNNIDFLCVDMLMYLLTTKIKNIISIKVVMEDVFTPQHIVKKNFQKYMSTVFKEKTKVIYEYYIRELLISI